MPALICPQCGTPFVCGSAVATCPYCAVAASPASPQEAVAALSTLDPDRRARQGRCPRGRHPVAPDALVCAACIAETAEHTRRVAARFATVAARHRQAPGKR